MTVAEWAPKTGDTDNAFFVIQLVFSSHPGDPIADRLRQCANQLAGMGGVSAQVELTAAALQTALSAIDFVEYAVWDFALDTSVARSEYTTWREDLKNAAATAPDEEDIAEFLAADMLYFFWTFAVLTKFPPTVSFLNSYLSADQSTFFIRPTLANLLLHFARFESGTLAGANQALLSVAPAPPNLFRREALQASDCDYLTPIF